MPRIVVTLNRVDVTLDIAHDRADMLLAAQKAASRGSYPSLADRCQGDWCERDRSEAEGT